MVLESMLLLHVQIFLLYFIVHIMKMKKELIKEYLD